MRGWFGALYITVARLYSKLIVLFHWHLNIDVWCFRALFNVTFHVLKLAR